MKNLMVIFLAALTLVLCGSVQAATLNVPTDYLTIQSAIGASVYGDTIQVAAGTYYERITLKDGVAIIGAGESVTIIDGGAAGSVVTSSGCGTDTVLEGFTITNGSAYDGGGMYNYSSSPTVTDCTFSGNSAAWMGGGMHNYYYSSPTVTNCTFSGNSGIYGGGMCNYTYEESGSNPTLTNCIMWGNTAKWGGGMSNVNSSPTVTNCTFSSNTATSGHGGGMSNNYYSNPTVSNCILWGDTASTSPEISNSFSTPTVTYSDIEGGYTGTGNINADPLFADADLRLSAGSLCIDAGDNTAVPGGVTTDLDGNPRIVGPAVDIGAYESQHSSNRPPVANAGVDQTVERESHEGTQVTLDGSGSSDPDGDPLTYEWTWDGGSASGVNPTIVLPLGTTTITLVVNDGTVNSEPDMVNITVEDTTPPQVEIIFPIADLALQDVVTLTAVADDWSGVSDVYFYVREPDGGDGIPIGCEDLPAAWNGTTELWEFDFDTTGLLDGYYVILARAEDTQGNEGWSEVVPFSIRNWAILELLPASKSSKAGRTMPVKFSLRIAESVDAMMPFVYNEELEIRIYKYSDPENILLQTSTYGDTSRDYRIDSIDELYITNFKTMKQPAQYEVEIWRLSKDFLVENFTFETVK